MRSGRSWPSSSTATSCRLRHRLCGRRWQRSRPRSRSTRRSSTNTLQPGDPEALKSVNQRMGMNSTDWTGRRGIRLAFWGVVGLFLVYAGLFIYRTSFVVGGERYFSLFDDAMISIRYGRNLAHGYGLVWNPGARPVEGYTNPAWVLYMTAIHLLPVAASKTSLVVQITAALLLAINLIFVGGMALEVSAGSD